MPCRGPGLILEYEQSGREKLKTIDLSDLSARFAVGAPSRAAP